MAIEGEKQAPRLPWWITFDHDRQDYVLNDNADIVRQVIQKRLAGISDRKIAVWLNEQRYASPRGTTWKETPVRKLYRHPAVYGAYQTMRTVRDNPDDHTTARFINDALVENYYPALVSYHEYQALAPKSVPRGKTNDHNHLRRLVRCSCGQVEKNCCYACFWRRKACGRDQYETFTHCKVQVGKSNLPCTE